MESLPEAGARFQVRLPAALSERPDPPSERAVPSSTRRARVLVVDDEPLLRQQYLRVLGGVFDVQVAESAQEARRLIDTFSFDVILCDVMMPRESGVALARDLLRKHPSQARRLIFISGGVPDEDAAAFVQRWENGFLHKPIGSRELREALFDFLKTSDSSRPDSA